MHPGKGLDVSVYRSQEVYLVHNSLTTTNNVLSVDSQLVAPQIERKVICCQLEFRAMMTFALMTTGTFSQNVRKLFSELKLVTDNLSLKKGTVTQVEREKKYWWKCSGIIANFAILLVFTTLWE